jgi:RsiW-degrading membrane proteinase PrsW (M82 family)
MISVTCSKCGREHEISEALAGLPLLCKGCSNRLSLPSRPATPAAPANPPSSVTSPPAGVGTISPARVFDAPAPAHPAAPPYRPDRAAEPPNPSPLVIPEVGAERNEVPPSQPEPPQTPATAWPRHSDELPFWLRHMHWLLVLALIPLGLSLLRPDAEEDLLTRLEDTLAQASPEEREQILNNIKYAGDGDALEALFDALPEHKLAGAFLPRHSWAHWGFAAGAAVLFMAFFVILTARGTAEPRHLLWVALFTATAGIVLLLLFQWLAGWSQSVWLSGRGVVVILFYIVKFIGFSYRAASDPENGFFLSLVGFTCGVGLCEEVVKALPLLWLYRRGTEQGWRGAFVWGLASGAGFGIAEGVMYAGSYYNGISGSEIYLVRFISCVALHAVWTGSAAITLNRRQEMFQGDMAWYDFIPPLLRVVAVPIVLHGLYDTLLKKEMNPGALVVAGLSFLFLAYQISRAHRQDAEAAGAPLSAPQ